MRSSAPLRLTCLALFLSACATTPPAGDRTERRLPPGSFVSGKIVSLGDATVLNEDDYIQAFALSPDLKTVAAVRHDAIFYNWSLYGVETRRRGADQKLCHSEYDPEGIVFYGDTTRIATISHDGIARLWDVSSGKTLWQYRTDPHKRRLYGLTKARDGRIAFCDERGNIFVVRPEPNTDEKASLIAAWKAHDGECRGLRFAGKRDDLLYSGGWDKTVAVWTDDGTLRGRIDVGHFVNDIDLDARGDRIVVATSLERPELNFEVGKAVLAGTYGRVEEGNGFSVIDADTGETVRSWTGARGPVTDAAISPDGEFVAVGGWDFTVRLVSVSDGRLVGSVKTDRQVQMLRFSPEGTRLVVGNWTRPYSGNAALTVYALALEEAKTVMSVE